MSRHAAHHRRCAYQDRRRAQAAITRATRRHQRRKRAIRRLVLIHQLAAGLIGLALGAGLLTLLAIYVPVVVERSIP